jgi:hypothetical protein
MALWDTSFDAIDAARLQALVKEEVLEGLHIEYKRALDLTTHEGKRAFLKTAAGFANSAGGDLVIGMETEGGRPMAIVSVTGAPDDEKLRLDSIARDNIEPRLHGFRVKEIALPEGYALLVRVPQSLNPPHRVTTSAANKFYGRSSAGSYELGIEELRRLFTVAPRLADRVRDFRADRIMKIVAGDTPVELAPRMRTVVHIVPLTRFSEGRNRTLIAAAAQRWGEFAPLGYGQLDSSHRFNLDGMFTVPHQSADDDTRLAYAHVFASGAVESVEIAESEVTQPSALVLELAEMRIVRAVTHFARALISCGVDGPFAILVSLLDAKGMQTAVGSRYRLISQRRIDRDHLHCEEVVLDNIPEEAGACALALRDVLDQVANAAGFVASPHFGPSGQWQQAKMVNQQLNLR